MIARRNLALLAGVPVLAACAAEETTAEPSNQAPSSTAPPADVETRVVATVDEVPVGGGIVLQSDNLVLTQPTAGEFRAFSATCTHAGCQMASVTDRINCGCHGSTFALTDGANTAGPNGSAAGSIGPLAAKFVEVTGSKVRVEV